MCMYTYTVRVDSKHIYIHTHEFMNYGFFAFLTPVCFCAHIRQVDLDKEMYRIIYAKSCI